MTTREFLTQFSMIENHLFSIAPTFDRKQGYFSLLEYLQSNNFIANNLSEDLYEIFQLRNKIVNSPSGEIVLTTELVNKIQKVKQSLNI